MKKHSAVAGLALALVAGSAFAADLPSRKEALLPPPPPPFTWTGLYGGVNIGYGFGDGDQDPGYAITAFPAVFGTPAWTISNDMNGVLGGGQVGYNYQFNPWLVVGLEADIQATDVHSQGTASARNGLRLPRRPQPATNNFVYATQNKSLDWFGTVRGTRRRDLPELPEPVGLWHGRLGLWRRGPQRQRFGLLSQRPYLFPVVPSARARSTGAGSNYDSTKVGWTAGGGVEWFPFTSHSAVQVLLGQARISLHRPRLDHGLRRVDRRHPGFLPFPPFRPCRTRGSPTSRPPDPLPTRCASA